MARVHPFQTNFTAGELTPKLAGQVDFKKYNNGVEIMENMTVFPQGGASRRYGTRFVKEVKDSSKETRLIPFEFSTTQTYIDRKSTRLNSSHLVISYAVFFLKKKTPAII